MVPTMATGALSKPLLDGFSLFLFSRQGQVIKAVLNHDSCLSVPDGKLRVLRHLCMENQKNPGL